MNELKDSFPLAHLQEKSSETEEIRNHTQNDLQ